MLNDRVKGDMEKRKSAGCSGHGRLFRHGLACAAYLAGRGFSCLTVLRGRAASGAQPRVTSRCRLPTLPTMVRWSRQWPTVLEREGRLDIVVNNAGMGIAGPVENTSIEQAKRQFEVNFCGLCGSAARYCWRTRRQRSGYIVNIGSIGGLLAIPYQSMYSASKFALEGLSEALRMEVKPFGVRVVIIEPGASTRRPSPKIASSLSTSGCRRGL